ncbi:uncharacterized protein KGF55_003183 [Candida pseudojiufengensis]|uniref:uncharacterized protein n=1 Tax=Candida pseudojiufengensis TaxID=497109 RepID=UPI002225218C|nr:uncharacterized protein KGF55_003183 [Candida pseudojiufengensis]KAI5962107.1 hypothetical protein KGF55_003183 [Candida pseudojiufengensis]
MPESIHTMSSKAAKEHNKHIIQPPSFTTKAIKNYFKTRITSLWVGKKEWSKYTWYEILNPFPPLLEMNLHQWNFFFMGAGYWTLDALDFFITTLNVTDISESLGKSKKDITWGITLVLMFRTLGAIIFGLIGDRYGRKWPFIVNLVLLCAIQIGTGFVKTYSQFLAVRAIFGICMGGVFGVSLAEAISDAPASARGILSGAFQSCYSLGFLISTVFQRAFEKTKHTWQNMFFFSAGLSFIFIVWRLFNPETDSYQRQKERFSKNANAKNSKWAEFKSSAGKALKSYWLIIIYLVIMMSGFNFSSHGSQDLYPTMLSAQYGYGPNRITVVNVCANLGAIAGGIAVSHLSNFIGRRTAIMCGNILAGAFIYPWAFKPMWITAFMMQFGIQGAWGVVPIHLSELSPPQFKAFVTGVAYQLGNLVSSASSTIEATIEESLHDYGRTMAIFVGAVVAFLFCTVLLGPENRHASLSVERDDEYSIFEVDDDEEDEENESKLDDKIDDITFEKPEVEHKA